MSEANRWDVMSVREYTTASGEQKTNWTKVGVGFTNKNGSINVQLDAIPIDGKLQLQVPLTQEQRDELFNKRGQGGRGQGRSQQHEADRGFGGQGNPRNAGQQQRQQVSQKYGQRGASTPRQGGFGSGPREYAPARKQETVVDGEADDTETGWDVNGAWVTDPRDLPTDHPDFMPF